MKLQSQISRKIGIVEYEKFWIIIPQKIIKKLNWKSGQILNADIKNKKLIISLESEKAERREDGHKRSC